MVKVHYRVIWVPEQNMFSITFKPLEEGASSGLWYLTPDNLIKMIERAEAQMQAMDGQNRVNRSYCFEFLDKNNNDVHINLDHAGKECFEAVTDYMRQVYESWKEYWKDKHATKN